jgi:hypothetical protein
VAWVFDDLDIFNDQEGTIATVREYHRDAEANRAELMALLLTDLSDPDALAAQVHANLAAERLALEDLLERIDYPAEPWVVKRGSGTVTLEGRPFHKQRAELTRVIGLIEAEGARCAARLAARKSDMERRLEIRHPDRAEEPDAVVRVWASQLGERARNRSLPQEILDRTARHTRSLIDRRIADHEKMKAEHKKKL